MGCGAMRQDPQLAAEGRALVPVSRSSVVGGGLWGRRSAEGTLWGPHSLEALGAPEALVYPWEPCGWSFGPCWLTTSGLKTVHRLLARVFIYLFPL